MQITLKKITIRELAENYAEDAGTGRVSGFGGKLDIRPIYQREFVYKEAQRNAVIDTVFKGFPLNVMYWSDREDGTFEVIDGQQRTISVCRFVAGDFSFDKRYFSNLAADERERFLDYPLMVYVCRGSDSEKLEWFKTINIAGEELTPQELRNAVYAGTWTADAKRYFSRNGCPAFKIGHKYLTGSPIRQEFLETALKWISDGNIEDYMGRHQHDANAEPLWAHFHTVIAWIEKLFPKYFKEMKGVPWGELYAAHKDENFDVQELEEQVETLMADVDVTNKKGIFSYVLGGDERELSVRAFDDRMKREAYQRQRGVCPHCKKHFAIEEMEGDHITPWCEGGKTVAENCQMLCKRCNREKGAR